MKQIHGLSIKSRFFLWCHTLAKIVDATAGQFVWLKRSTSLVFTSVPDVILLLVRSPFSCSGIMVSWTWQVFCSSSLFKPSGIWVQPVLISCTSFQSEIDVSCSGKHLAIIGWGQERISCYHSLLMRLIIIWRIKETSPRRVTLWNVDIVSTLIEEKKTT